MKRAYHKRFGICAVVLLSICACEGPGQTLEENNGNFRTLTLIFKNAHLPFSQTRSSSMPPEDRLTDVNLFVFNTLGDLEYKNYYKLSSSPDETTEYGTSISLLSGKHYCIMVCANIGYSIHAENISQLQQYSHSLAYPDEFHQGMIMSAVLEDVCMNDTDKEIEVELKRAMAKINVCIDRSRLDEDVDIFVKSIKVGACPRMVKLFSSNIVESKNELFGNGYYLSGTDTDRLNTGYGDGRSGTVSLYCCENLRATEDKDLSTYIQIEADYLSSTHKTEGGSSIYYRFFIKTQDGTCGVERNCLYNVTVMPEGDGLNGGEWRVDKSNLVESYSGESWFKFYPSNYIECHIGDTLHLWCDYRPTYAECIIDNEYLEEDRSRGIYDYQVDGDGRGVKLVIRKGGTGIVLFDVEEPVNDGAMCLILSEP